MLALCSLLERGPAALDSTHQIELGRRRELFRYQWDGRKGGAPRKGRWTQAELARLREQFGLRDERLIARELNRSVASVRKMGEDLFRDVAPRTGPWSADEVQRLKRYLGASTPDVISRILGRNEAEVRSQISELGRLQDDGQWTRDELIHFKRIFGSRSDEDVSLIFGRSLKAVRALAEQLRLAKDKAFIRKRNGQGATRMPRWSDEELLLLRQSYPSTANLEIARRLGRSVKSVVSKAQHMGLRKDPVRLQEMGRENVSVRYQERAQGIWPRPVDQDESETRPPEGRSLALGG